MKKYCWLRGVVLLANQQVNFHHWLNSNLFIYQAIMERCPTCQFVGKSLRKHYDKKPRCKFAWQEQQEREKALEEISGRKVNSDENEEMSDLSVVHSDNDITVTSIQDKSHQGSLRSGDEVQEIVADVHPEAERINVEKLGFTVNQYCETELLKILNDKHVPHGIYQDVLEWSRRAKRMKYSFEPTRTKRSTQIRHLTRWQSQ